MADPREAEPWKNWMRWRPVFDTISCVSLLHLIAALQSTADKKNWGGTSQVACRQSRLMHWTCKKQRNWLTSAGLKVWKCEALSMVLHVFTAWSSYSVFSGEQSVRDFPFTQVGCAKAKRARYGPFNYPALRGQLVPSAETQVAFCFFTLDPSPRAIFSCVALTCIASCLVTAMWTVPWYADQAKCACMPLQNFLNMILCLRHRRIPHELLMFVSSTSWQASKW